MATVRKAIRKDRTAIIDMWMRLAEYHAALDPVYRPSPQAPKIFGKFLKRCLKSNDALVLLAEIDGSPVGMCTALIDNNSQVFEVTRFGRLADLYVGADYRRRGIGTQLLREVQRWLAANGVAVCRASAAEQNPALENFWLKSGFFRRIAILENNFGGGPQ